ncbi:MAG: SDR family NAD(P)-dependent oxidoreductase [Leptospiraceae bacterium]|nr:SDR family NAD(P)-dependent oxidoreductase [Leptospiraceae bacterium]
MAAADLEGKNILITGANGGIGLETARALLASGARVIITGRDASKTTSAVQGLQEAGLSAIHSFGLDLAEPAEIQKLSTELHQQIQRLDIIIHNAGAFNMKRKTNSTGQELTLAVNYLAPVLLTHLLQDLLPSDAGRVLMVSSMLHRKGKAEFSDMNAKQYYSGQQAYNNTKLWLTMYTNWLARQWRNRGVVVNSLHPGVIATDIARDLPAVIRWPINLFLKTPRQGARTSIWAASSAEAGTLGGQYFNECKAEQCAPSANDERLQQELVTKTAELLGITLP